MENLGAMLESLGRSNHAQIYSAESLATLRAAWDNEPIGALYNCPAWDKPQRSQPWCEPDPCLFYVESE